MRMLNIAWQKEGFRIYPSIFFENAVLTPRSSEIRKKTHFGRAEKRYTLFPGKAGDVLLTWSTVRRIWVS